MSCTFLLAQFLILASLGAESSDAKQRFLIAYEPAVRRLSDRLSKRCRMIVREQSFHDGKPAAEASLEFLANDHCILVKTTENAVGNEEDNRALIAWHLLRPDGAYVIHKAKKADGYLLFRRSLGGRTASEAGWPFAEMTIPLMRFNHFLLSHIQKPEVQVLHFGEAVKEGNKLRELKVKEKINSFSFVSYYYFDTSDDWLLHSFVVEPTDGSDRVIVRYQYKNLDGERVPERVESNSVNSTGKSKRRFIIDYELFQRANPSESEFSLERFGLPESVNFIPPKTTRIHLWILVAAGCCAILAFFFRFIARRYAASSK